MDIHEKKSVDMDVAMDGKFHIHSKPVYMRIKVINRLTGVEA